MDESSTPGLFIFGNINLFLLLIINIKIVVKIFSSMQFSYTELNKKTNNDALRFVLWIVIIH